MQALSIRPEFAMEILVGEKTEEYRTWKTHHRGDLLICNSARKRREQLPVMHFVWQK